MTLPLDLTRAAPYLVNPVSLGDWPSEAAWIITWSLLAAWTPPPLHPWRRFLLRLFGAKISSTARIYGTAQIWYPPNLEMGAHSILGWDVLCYCQDRIVLKDFANVAQRSHLCAGTHDSYLNFQLLTKPIVIGKHAWVASDALGGPGVTLSEGAVLGARGVAFRDLDAWTVYIGNPAMPIRSRRRQ